jgi:pre-mRNA-processing factor 17
MYARMQGVRDITFSNDGRRFVSTGYDKNIRLWDTETGTVLQTFNTGKVSE